MSRSGSKRPRRKKPRPASRRRAAFTARNWLRRECKAHLKPRRRCAPSPLAGEGWGGGSTTAVGVRGTPTPAPSPQGGGEQTELADEAPIKAAINNGEQARFYAFSFAASFCR